MGFPILSLIVTRIIGIPQSSLLRVFGIPQFSPWVYGIPHALLRLSLKVVSRSYSFRYRANFHSSSHHLQHGHGHWLDMGCTSNYTMSNLAGLTCSIVNQNIRTFPLTELFENSKDRNSHKEEKKGIPRTQKGNQLPLPVRANCPMTGPSIYCPIATTRTVADVAGRAPSIPFLSFPPCLSCRSPSVGLSHSNCSISNFQVSTPSRGLPDQIVHFCLYPCPSYHTFLFL